MEARKPPVILSIGLAGCVAAASYFVFFRPEASHLLFSVFLFIFIAAAWLGPLAARLIALVISGAAIWATHSGVGAFTGGGLFENLQNLDLFLAAVSLTGVALGAFRASGSLALPATILLGGWIHKRVAVFFSRTESHQLRLRSVRQFRTFSGKPSSHPLDDLRDGTPRSRRISRGLRTLLRRGMAHFNYRLELLEHYPGTVAVEVIQPVPDSKLGQFVAAERHEAFPQFQLSPRRRRSRRNRPNTM